jgi:hypothetical protein
VTYPNVELFPERFIAGDELDIGPWTFDDYPASTWDLSWALVVDGSQLQLTAQESGDDFSLTIGSAFTAAFPPGLYSWQAYVTDVGGDRTTIGEGVVEVITDFDQQGSGFDARSPVKKTLDAIVAVIENRATKDQMGYTIQGRSLARTLLSDLVEFRAKYQQLYDAELKGLEALKGKTSSNLHKTRFV